MARGDVVERGELRFSGKAWWLGWGGGDSALGRGGGGLGRGGMFTAAFLAEYR